MYGNQLELHLNRLNASTETYAKAEKKGNPQCPFLYGTSPGFPQNNMAGNIRKSYRNNKNLL